ncbi:MAG: RHS repeat protein, partial [Acidobacteria bacterium]|nr:RHS repeat protein [Acidobacteriota bacterium]
MGSVPFWTAGGFARAALTEVENLRFLTENEIAWDALPGTAGYHLYVGDLARLPKDFGQCHLGSLQTTRQTLPLPTASGQGSFILVGGFDEEEHGPLGFTSAGQPRIPTAPCIPSRRPFDLVIEVGLDGLLEVEPVNNPNIDERETGRESTGVVLHSGEFVVLVEDTVGGAGKPSGGLGKLGGLVKSGLAGGVSKTGGLPGSSDIGGLSKVGGIFSKLGRGHSKGQLGGIVSKVGGTPSKGLGGLFGGKRGGIFGKVIVGQKTGVLGKVGGILGSSMGKGGSSLPAPGHSTLAEAFLDRVRRNASPFRGMARLPRALEAPGEEEISSDPAEVGGKPPDPDVVGGQPPEPDVPAPTSEEGEEEAWIRRQYRSAIRYSGPLGNGWDFTANSRLAPAGPDVDWLDGTGRRFRFTRTAGGGFLSPPGIYSVLVEEAGGFLLRDPDGTVSRFHPFDGSNLQGTLLAEEDLDGNTVRYLYDHQGLLTTIVDDLGRSIRLTYDLEGRITSISDHTGRSVTFAYDANGDLAEARTPAVFGTPNGNDFPAGKATLYTYTSAFADQRLNHNLTSITAPNQAGTGPPVIQMIYGTDPFGFDLDRVIAQTIGGTLPESPPAGGTLTFAYEALNPGADPLLLDLPRRRTIVTDRNGNLAEYLHNASGHLLTEIERTNRNLRPGEPDYTTEYRYNGDGELVTLLTPEGSMALFTYDRPGADRYREGDLIEARLVADSLAAGGRGDGHGSEAADRVWTFEYEPVANELMGFVDPRGNDPGYVPQNGGAGSPARYRTAWTFDYQEGDPAANGINLLASRFGISLAGTAFNLGDLNGDGRTDQAGAHPVRMDEPSVMLDPASNQAGIGGDTSQEIVTLIAWNDHGQLTSVRDAEGNTHELEYHPEDDPDGDGIPSPPPDDGRVLDLTTGGYLKSVTLDTTPGADRNNRT